jgi:hypothetical protein
VILLQSAKEKGNQGYLVDMSSDLDITFCGMIQKSRIKIKYLLTLHGGGGCRMIFVSINFEEGDFCEKSVFLSVLFCGFIVF